MVSPKSGRDGLIEIKKWLVRADQERARSKDESDD